MSGWTAIRGIGRTESPGSLATWLRYQVESIPRIARGDRHFSAVCAAASLRLKLGSAVRANLIDTVTAAQLRQMLDEQVGKANEPA